MQCLDPANRQPLPVLRLVTGALADWVQSASVLKQLPQRASDRPHRAQVRELRRAIPSRQWGSRAPGAFIVTFEWHGALLAMRAIAIATTAPDRDRRWPVPSEKA